MDADPTNFTVEPLVKKFQFPAVGLSAPPELPVIVCPTVAVFIAIVTADPTADIVIPAPLVSVTEFSAGIAVPEPVTNDVGIAGTSVISKDTVTLDNEAVVSIPVPPRRLILFKDGVAVPESLVKVVGTLAPASILMVPGPLVIVTVLPDEVKLATLI